MRIRTEKESDRATVYQINTAAFERCAGAKLVETLRGCVRPFISLIVEVDAAVVGHVMFSPVSVSADSSPTLMGSPNGRGVGISPSEYRFGSCSGRS